MRLKRLILRDFRNYERLDVTFPPGIVVLAGPNGAGKSNLLEAMHYLSYLRSFRPARDREVIRYHTQMAVVEAHLLDDGERPLDARLVLQPQTRHLRFNGQDITRFRDFIGRLHSQFFFPGDLALIAGDPTVRRELLDLELLRLKPALAPVYQHVHTALRERNRVLKLLYPEPGQRHPRPAEHLKLLAAYTEQFINAGSQVIRERRGLVHVLDALFAPLYQQLAPPEGETVNLKYISQIELEPDSLVTQHLRERLKEAEPAEVNLRYTSVGPQRDDLGLILNGERDLRRFGSQGQVRSAALALRLALCQLSHQRLNDDPLLLLDDALSEMDDGRKQRLLGLCRKHRQVFITSASEREVGLIAPLAQAVFEVGQGRLKPIARLPK